MYNSDNGGRDTAKHIAIVLTDGNSNINADDTIQKAIDSRASGIHIIVIGIGDQLNSIEMNGIASDPTPETVFFATSYRDLPEIVDELVNAVCDGRFYSAFFLN